MQKSLLDCSIYNKTAFINSPFNYTGSKFKLLPFILPLFPNNINTAIDLFCGGGSVGVNINAKKIFSMTNKANLLISLNFFKCKTMKIF
ncbi:DNA adenine methylase [Helicobacter trogontum]|uniref:DNA adenine methylase n=1 Tax=Helicobacter trogontum TaxID=50960 RepID=UPI00051D5401|nr:DNA adenine methylase [Helicobacter trogontum]